VRVPEHYDPEGFRARHDIDRPFLLFAGAVRAPRVGSGCWMRSRAPSSGTACRLRS
jgi:hypothetical protein